MPRPLPEAILQNARLQAFKAVTRIQIPLGTPSKSNITKFSAQVYTETLPIIHPEEREIKAEPTKAPRQG